MASKKEHLLFVKVLFHQGEQLGSQQEQCDQVGDGHEAVGGIGDAPDQTQIQSGAHDCHQRIDSDVRLNDLVSKEELHAAGTVKTPTENGGECEAAHCNGGEDGDPVAVDSSEACDGQFGTGSLTVRNGNAAEKDDQSSHGADDDGVHKDFEDAKHTLLNGLIGVSAGVGDGTGTKTCLIGENAAGNALFHTQEEVTYHTAGDGCGIEGTVEDAGEDGGDLTDIQHDQTNAQQNIDHSHKGNQSLGDLTQALDAAQQDYCTKIQIKTPIMILESLTPLSEMI